MPTEIERLRRSLQFQYAQLDRRPRCPRKDPDPKERARLQARIAQIRMELKAAEPPPVPVVALAAGDIVQTYLAPGRAGVAIVLTGQRSRKGRVYVHADSFGHDIAADNPRTKVLHSTGINGRTYKGQDAQLTALERFLATTYKP